MTDSAALKRAVERVDQTCPCYLRQRQCGASKPGMLSTGCKCWPSIQQDPRERIIDPECIAPGHAAIREAVRAAAEWGQKSILTMNTQPERDKELDAILSGKETERE